MNPLRKAVRDYLTMRRGLGFKMARHEVGLQDFVSFLERKRRNAPIKAPSRSVNSN